ncbi:MAG TPA: hypothetical protein VHJ20_20205, partial [Polyangia bacterium]|nr:hypothetical protein [Polyangia bacterium]
MTKTKALKKTALSLCAIGAFSATMTRANVASAQAPAPADAPMAAPAGAPPAAPAEAPAPAP